MTHTVCYQHVTNESSIKYLLDIFELRSNQVLDHICQTLFLIHILWFEYSNQPLWPDNPIYFIIFILISLKPALKAGSYPSSCPKTERLRDRDLEYERERDRDLERDDRDRDRDLDLERLSDRLRDRLLPMTKQIHFLVYFSEQKY